MAGHRTEIPQSVQSLPSLTAIALWLAGKDIQWWAAVMGLLFIALQIGYVAWKWMRDIRIERERVPFGVRYERDPVTGGLELVPVEGANVHVVAQTMRLADRIAALLRERGVLHVKDIAEELEGSSERKSVEKMRMTLRRHSALFRDYSDGTWSMKNWQPKRKPDDRPTIRIINPADDYEDLP